MRKFLVKEFYSEEQLEAILLNIEKQRKIKLVEAHIVDNMVVMQYKGVLEA